MISVSVSVCKQWVSDDQNLRLLLQYNSFILFTTKTRVYKTLPISHLLFRPTNSSSRKLRIHLLGKQYQGNFAKWGNENKLSYSSFNKVGYKIFSSLSLEVLWCKICGTESYLFCMIKTWIHSQFFKIVTIQVQVRASPSPKSKSRVQVKVQV